MPGWTGLRLSRIEKLMPIIWAYRYDRASDRFIGIQAGVNIEQIFGKTFTGTAMEELYPPRDYPRLFERAKRVTCGPAFYRGVGMVFNFVAASLTGVAISYAIGQAAPMVAAVWGIVAWKEFDGSSTRARLYLALMFVFFIAAIVLASQAYRTAA